MWFYCMAAATIQRVLTQQSKSGKYWRNWWLTKAYCLCLTLLTKALLQVWKKTRLAYVFLRNTTLRFWLPALSQRTLACTTNVSVPSRWLHLQQPLQKRRSHKLKRLSALSTQTHQLTVLPLSLIF
ncbi:Uncharacterised protein [Vibrio cholerae]|nr:Uncharacterised protein [Vibrio cholerae]CSC18774.1 Uncharacterised protein [Vibrio cholerae]